MPRNALTVAEDRAAIGITARPTVGPGNDCHRGKVSYLGPDLITCGSSTA
jgi:hypothetical protein